MEILWNDDSCAVCVKPAGLLSQGNEKSAVTVLSRQICSEVYPVHRLDRDVGGVMVYAKTPESAARLSRMFRQHEVSKEYLAVLRGKPAETGGVLRDLLYHDAQRNKTYVVERRRKGVREAELRYLVLDTAEGETLVQVQLLTGRTHQIRVQFASRGMPIAGDGRYGGGSGHIQLWSMALTLPVSGRMRRFSALPEQIGPFSPNPLINAEDADEVPL